jgi:Domain of unknown function (DUF6265)
MNRLSGPSAQRANLSNFMSPKNARSKIKLWLKSALLLCVVATISLAQEHPPAAMVRTWTDGMVSPAATIDDIRWMVGDWKGGLDGGMQEYTAFPPVDRHVPGFGRGWGQDGSIWYYEINDFIEVNGSIEFRVKHFSSELKGWEGKDEFVRHRLIEKTEGALYFDGLTVVREGSEHYTVYVRINEGDRKGQVVVVHETRVSKR